MRVDELPKNQAEFFTELQALCKKYNAEIGGCGCCDSPFGYVDDWKNSFGNLDVAPDYLTVEIKGVQFQLYTDPTEYHDIEVTEEVVYPDGAVNNYHFTKYNATCKKCGKTAARDSRVFAIADIERYPCKGVPECK